MNFPDLSRVTHVGLDTETTGKSYDDRPVGASVSLPNGGGDFYFAWGHPSGNNCTFDDFREWVEESERRNPGLVWVVFNALFDTRMLAYKGLRLRNRIEDAGYATVLLNELDRPRTLEAVGWRYCGEGKSDEELLQYCASHFGGKPTPDAQGKNYHRVPGDVIAEYAMDDASLTRRIWEAAIPRIDDEGLRDTYEVETALIPTILRMHLVGVRVDVDGAQDVKKKIAEREAQAWARWEELVGKGKKPTSGVDLAKIFDERGWKYRRGAITEKMAARGVEQGNPSFEKEWLKTLPEAWEIPALIVDLRELAHFRGTFIDSYIVKNARNGIVHGEFHQLPNDKYGAVSGRFSSGGGLNLQNVPKRDRVKAPLVRGLYIPYYQGQRWLRLDYSQIEYRYLAHYAGGMLLRAYADDPDADFHAELARMTGLERDAAKTLNFAICYGQGIGATAEQLGISYDEAKALLETYHSRAPEIKRLQRRASRLADERGYIVTWGGRLRRFEPVTDDTEWGRHKKTHKALNALLQGSAADLIKKAMIQVAAAIDWDDCILHLTVHDELDFSVTPGETGERYVKMIKDCMEDYKLRVPVRADAEVGPDWGHCTEWKPGALLAA